MSVDPKSVGLFIEIKDRDNKEIWEGDIVKDETRHPSFANYKIEFYGTGFRGVSNSGDDYGPYTLNLYINDKNPIIKVVGNIHDNPDMLQ